MAHPEDDGQSSGDEVEVQMSHSMAKSKKTLGMDSVMKIESWVGEACDFFASFGDELSSDVLGFNEALHDPNMVFLCAPTAVFIFNVFRFFSREWFFGHNF